MSKFQAIAASTLLLFVPGIYLLYLLVMLYISHSETISVAVQVTAAIGLLACVIGVLYPFLCLIMAPSPPKTAKISAPSEILEDDAPESEAFESEEVDAYDDDDEFDDDSGDSLEADSNMEFDDDEPSDDNLDVGFDDEDDDFEIAVDDDDDFDTFDLDADNELDADSFDMDMFTDDE